MRMAARTIALFILAILTACGGGDDDTPTDTYSISGFISGAEGVPIAEGIPVHVSGPISKTTITDVHGAFSVKVLLPGPYTITPIQPGFVFSPVGTFREKLLHCLPAWRE